MSQTSKKKRTSKGSNLGTLLVLAIIVGFGFLYIALGTDPLGILSAEETPIPATLTSRPATTVPSTSTPIVATGPATSTPEAIATSVGATAVSGWWEVYFVSPVRIRQAEEEAYGANGLPPELLQGSITEKLIQRIEEAQKTIHIASFETDIVDVARALIRAKQRGVDVRWITDDEYGTGKDKNPGHGQFKLLREAGIEVKDDGRSALMHNKFWIFDSRVVWTGSTNVTISGMFEQNNNTIVIESPELAVIYERQWEEMWGGQFNARSPSTIDQQKVNIQGTNVQVLFSPEDKVVENLTPYVQNAKKSIYFMAFVFTHPLLGDATLDAAKRGVKVSGVFEKTGSETEFSELTPLYCLKAPVRQDSNFAFMHHKVFIIDERYVITGSLNFTENASRSNNENIIIIDNPEIAKLYIEEFQRVYDVATDPDPTKITCK